MAQVSHYGISTTIEPLTTSDNAWTQLVNYGLGQLGSLGGAGRATAHVTCRNPSTNAAAVWEQPIAVEWSSSAGSLSGGILPEATVSQKETALLLTDIRVTFDGLTMAIECKGLNAADLIWCCKLNIDIAQAETS